VARCVPTRLGWVQFHFLKTSFDLRRLDSVLDREDSSAR
jgi:hypothetical protein